jgi:L-lactate dehydrogenase
LDSDGPPVTPFLTVCSPLAEAAGVGGVTLSVPHLVGGNGILGTLPFALSEDEQNKLATSSETVRDAITAVQAGPAI